jgi:hypothetical protein
VVPDVARHVVIAVLYSLIALFNAMFPALINAWLFVSEPCVICCVAADIAEVKEVFALWIQADCVGDGDGDRTLDDCCMLLLLVFDMELLLDALVVDDDDDDVVHSPLVQVFT